MMHDNPFDAEIFGSVQDSSKRVEALERYERCLADGTPRYLEEFIEKQLAHHPPELDLLFDVANDLQQRLLALREYHFDVRKRVVQAMLEIYQTDITHLAPPDQLHRYHLTDPKAIVETVQRRGFLISEKEHVVLTDMITSSLNICAQLYHDIEMTEALYQLLEDWLIAYNITSVRQGQGWDSHPPTDVLGFVQ